MLDLSFYYGKKVLVTGHTGFKGAWICQILLMAGADIVGYALDPPTDPSLFQMCGLSGNIRSVIGDIRDFRHLKAVFAEEKPEIVIHLAAQPLVRESYQNPVMTYETNIMGTVNMLECVRVSQSVRSCLNVTTDKVYRNKEWEWGYREEDELNGYEPYSNSKSCSELITSSYKRSFLEELDIAVSTARAGNVIGGGDFALDRIIPDCTRAAVRNETIFVRNPYSIRPYQHVIEAIMGYLLIAKEQYEDRSYAGTYNIGPNEQDCKTTCELVGLFCRKWNEATGSCLEWISQKNSGPHEANYLKLDCSRMKNVFGWEPKWDIETAIEKVVEWIKEYYENASIVGCMEKQVKAYFSEML